MVSEQGDLLAYGLGWPPTWCSTAASAEAWALHTVLDVCPFPPQLRTDCMALLSAAASGTARVTHHSRPLARIWKAIGFTLGCDVVTLVKNELLAWMPAHQSLRTIGEAKLSNGRRLTAIDWRSNRLVDALAKVAAKEMQASKDTLSLLASAEAAAGHAAALLGVVTHAANNHVRFELNDDGSTSRKVMRDSVDRPRHSRASARDTGLPQPAATTRATTASTCPSVAPWKPPSAAALARRQVAIAAEEALTASVLRIGNSMTQRSHQLTGRQRLEAVAARVAARASCGTGTTTAQGGVPK